ncbi:MAG: NAD(P)H-binding protein [Thermodesulfovibrionales bacterium]
MKIAIMGAPGCVGGNLIQKLLERKEYHVTGSFRMEKEIPKDLSNERLAWKQVNLLDPASAENFLNGSDVLIYLIHSLGAKNFEQLDIQLANAAGRAARSLTPRF